MYEIASTKLKLIQEICNKH